MGHSLNIKDTDVKVLGRTVSITTDNTFAAAEQLVDESFNPNVKYSGAFEDNSQWTINRLLKSKIDALSDGIPSDINPASTESYGIVRLASGTNDPDDYDVVTMNLFRPVYGDVENNKTRLAKLEECCEEVQEFIKKKDVAVINRIPNTTLSDEVWSEDGKSVTFKITADTGYYISDVDIDGLDIDVELTPNNEDYPTEYIVVITSENEIEYDIYVDGASKLIPSGEHTITVKGTGVKTLVFVVKSDQSDYISKMCSPVAGYQVSETYYDYHSTGSVPRDDRSDAIKYLPALQNVQVVFSPHLTLDLFRVSVTGTLDQDIVVDTTDLYSKIAGAVSIFNQNCRVTLSQLNKQGMLDVVRYGEDISGTILVYEGYSIKKAIWRYHDEDGESTDIDSTGRDIQINNNKFIISNPGWDIVEDGNGTFKWKNIRSVDLLIVAEEVQLCSITYNGSNYNTTNNATQVAYGDRYSTTITPASSSYKIDSVTVTMNGTPINQAWDRTTGDLTIGSVTGPVVITVNTSSNLPETVQYNVTYVYAGLTQANVKFGSSGNGQPIAVVTSGNKYNCTIAPASGYFISEIYIRTAASPKEHIAYTYENNILQSVDNITQDIEVCIKGNKNQLGATFLNVGDVNMSSAEITKVETLISNYQSKHTIPTDLSKYVTSATILPHGDNSNGHVSIQVLSSGQDWSITAPEGLLIDEGYDHGNGPKVVPIAVYDNTTYADKDYQIVITQGAGTGQVTFTLNLKQLISAKYAARLSDAYTASPYCEKTTSNANDGQIRGYAQHKFDGDWEIKASAGVYDIQTDPIETDTVIVTFTGGNGSSWIITPSSGDADTLMSFSCSSNSGDTGLTPMSLNLNSTLDVKVGSSLICVGLHKAFDDTNAMSYGKTEIRLNNDPSASELYYYIQNVTIGEDSVYDGTTTTVRSCDITGYGNNKLASVKIGNISNLEQKSITVYFGLRSPATVAALPAYTEDYIKDTLEQVVATTEPLGGSSIIAPLTVDAATNTITFPLIGGMIVPAGQETDWSYTIRIS